MLLLYHGLEAAFPFLPEADMAAQRSLPVPRGECLASMSSTVL